MALKPRNEARLLPPQALVSVAARVRSFTWERRVRVVHLGSDLSCTLLGATERRRMESDRARRTHSALSLSTGRHEFRKHRGVHQVSSVAERSASVTRLVGEPQAKHLARRPAMGFRERGSALAPKRPRKRLSHSTSWRTGERSLERRVVRHLAGASARDLAHAQPAPETACWLVSIRETRVADLEGPAWLARHRRGRGRHHRQLCRALWRRRWRRLRLSRSLSGDHLVRDSVENADDVTPLERPPRCQCHLRIDTGDDVVPLGAVDAQAREPIAQPPVRELSEKAESRRPACQ